MTVAEALALCCERMPSSFSVLELDGSVATDVALRTFSDGSSAAINLRAFSDRTLVAARGKDRAEFWLPARGIALFAVGALRDAVAAPSATTSLADVDWSLSLSAPNIHRVNFDEQKNGIVRVAAPLEDVRVVTRNCAMSYAVTASGRPIGLNEQPAKGDTVIRHVAEPYAFDMDGVKVVSPEPCNTLRPCYNPLYSQTVPMGFAEGEHRFTISSGEADNNFFLPALFLTGSFAVLNGAVMPLSQGKVKLGSLEAYGLGDFTGTATWSAEVIAPKAARARLRIATGGRVAHVKFAGRDLGVRAWAPFEWDVPVDLAGKKGLLEIAVSTSVQPMLGKPDGGKWDMRFWLAVSGPDGPCGLLSADWLEYAK